MNIMVFFLFLFWSTTRTSFGQSQRHIVKVCIIFQWFLLVYNLKCDQVLAMDNNWEFHKKILILFIILSQTTLFQHFDLKPASERGSRLRFESRLKFHPSFRAFLGRLGSWNAPAALVWSILSYTVCINELLTANA